MALPNSTTRLVLVVDDEAFLRLDAVDFLHDAGYATIEAVNANDALALVEGNPDIDVLFTDIDMPGEIDGLELAARISRCRPDMTVIIASGKTTPTAQQIPPRGHFVAKPYTSVSITALVQKCR